MMRLTRWTEWRAVRAAKHRAREILYHAAHARGMREDLAPPALLDHLGDTERTLRQAVKTGRAEAMQAAGLRVGEAVRALSPPAPHARWRERLETLVIAAAVAMSVRTYFIQPFKIPTGSMQPTLNGVRILDQKTRRWTDYPPLSFIGWALFGEGYVEVKARCAGYLAPYVQNSEDGMIVFVDRTAHRVRRGMELRVPRGAAVARGDVLASGRVQMGDHIFVNKVLYNFCRPTRGDVFVFDTSRVHHPAVRNDSFYIKRMVGLPGEVIRIDPPYLMADGKRILEPFPFRRMVEDPEYPGYRFAGGVSDPRQKPFLTSPEDHLALGPREYLPMGDNQLSSLDGRYFGAVPDDSIVGPAFWVYWPFTPHWGPIR
jgi:signal peptidase I